MHEIERRTHHVHTQRSGGAPSSRLLPSKWCRASRLGARCNQRSVRGAVDERQFPENQQAPITFSGATTNACRDQSRVFGSAGFGDEEKVHVENIDAVKLTGRLEALETSCFFDISEDVTGFRAGMVAAFHVAVTDWAVSENVDGEVESVRMASVLTVKARKGACQLLCLGLAFRCTLRIYAIKVEKCCEAGKIL